MPLHAGEPPTPHERSSFRLSLSVTRRREKRLGVRSRQYQLLRDDHELEPTRTEAPLIMSRAELDSITTRLEDLNISEGRVERPRSEPSEVGLPGLTALTCKVCGTTTISLCKGCCMIGYCSSEHQKEDWVKHTQECRTWSRSRTITASTSGPKFILSRSISLEPANEVPLESEINHMTALTIGITFEVDAILLPADKSLPVLVKAAFEVTFDHARGRVAHRERCFNELLGPAASWLPDAQWDEDIHQLSSKYPLSDEHKYGSRFSLHCRPNGKPNNCYAMLVEPDALRPSALSPTPIWGAIEAINPYSHGNGSFLVLRHPPGTCCPEIPGAFVENATLDDLEKVIPYLEQRRHFMSATGGVRNKISFCPH